MLVPSCSLPVYFRSLEMGYSGRVVTELFSWHFQGILPWNCLVCLWIWRSEHSDLGQQACFLSMHFVFGVFGMFGVTVVCLDFGMFVFGHGSLILCYDCGDLPVHVFVSPCVCVFVCSCFVLWFGCMQRVLQVTCLLDGGLRAWSPVPSVVWFVLFSCMRLAGLVCCFCSVRSACVLLWGGVPWMANTCVPGCSSSNFF